MMASKAAINPTWTLDLASLESWLASAEPGDELVFADGFASPHDAPAWKESIRLVGEGEVRVHHRRISARRIQHFMVRRTPEIAAAVAPLSAPIADDDDPSIRVLRAVRRWVNFRRPCPSNAEIARECGLPNPAAASYRLRCLVAAGIVSIEDQGPMRPRIVTIVATGKSTARGAA